jgi:hypothetical protein
MNAAELLDMARAAGLSLAVDGGEIVMNSVGPPPPAIFNLLRVHRAEIIAAITVVSQADHETDDAIVDWRGWYEERAAIRQFDGGYARDEAERLA